MMNGRDAFDCVCLLLLQSVITTTPLTARCRRVRRPKGRGMRHFSENSNIWKRFMLTKRNKSEFLFISLLYGHLTLV